LDTILAKIERREVANVYRITMLKAKDFDKAIHVVQRLKSWE
jgi:hypothetical protein